MAIFKPVLPLIMPVQVIIKPVRVIIKPVLPLIVPVQVIIKPSSQSVRAFRNTARYIFTTQNGLIKFINKKKAAQKVL